MRFLSGTSGNYYYRIKFDKFYYRFLKNHNAFLLSIIPSTTLQQTALSDTEIDSFFP